MVLIIHSSNAWNLLLPQTMADNVKFAVIFKLMCPIDGPCRSESKSTFNLKITAGFLEKSTFKKNKKNLTSKKNQSRKMFPLKFFIGSNERGDHENSKWHPDSVRDMIAWLTNVYTTRKNFANDVEKIPNRGVEISIRFAIKRLKKILLWQKI